MAMQFAYQFPEWAQRLVLIVSGGLGREVSPLLKAVSLPGPLRARAPAQPADPRRLEWPASWPEDRLASQRHCGRGVAQLHQLTDRHGQMAFVHTVRSVIDIAGQRVSAHDRLYLAKPSRR